MDSLQQSASLWQETLSFRRIIQRYRRKVVVTWILLFAEAVVTLLFPLVIGVAVDTLIDSSYYGLWMLGVLSVVVMIFGAGRRFYDTRAYASIYRDLTTSLVEHEHKQATEISKISARVSLLQEVVMFFENSLPGLIQGAIGLVGVIVVVALIDVQVMLACLVATGLGVIIYAVSGRRIFFYNEKQNDELERQVTVLTANNRHHVDQHFGRIMKWNIKLSDLETANFSLVWLVLASLMIISIVLIVKNPAISYGQKITSIMYVFNYIEVVMNFPFFYQEFVRLNEIMARLSGRLPQSA